MNWLALTHTQRWRHHGRSVGEGHVYQGRFKSFPVETNEYLLAVYRYVERNPVRAGLVTRAEHGGGAVLGQADMVEFMSGRWHVRRPGRNG